MVITYEKSPSDFLRNDSWCCDYLIGELDERGVDDSVLDEYVESMYPDGIGRTQLNDFFRFEADTILDAIAPKGDDEDSDED